MASDVCVVGWGKPLEGGRDLYLWLCSDGFVSKMQSN